PSAPPSRPSVHRIALQGPAALTRAEDDVTPPMLAVEPRPGVFVGDITRLVLVLADLLDDDLFLHVEVLDAQARSKDVGENVNRPGKIFRQDAGVKYGVL